MRRSFRFVQGDQRHIIDEVISLTGAAPPDWLDPDAPMFQTDAADETLHLIGVIGGKDVGKSSLVNALLGIDVARVTSFGEGTARALAYVHRDDVPRVRALLDGLIPQQFDLHEHDAAAGKHRVVLDLPDIDSIYATHVELTRKLLRHMLYPIWVQSIEKYADREPLQLLAKVAAGNAPENFLFVLTKADQLAARHGAQAVDELRADYAQRLARACAMAQSPRVYAIDNRDASSFDLTDLSEQVLAVRSVQAVARSRDLARQQQAKTLGGWLAAQKIDVELAATERLLETAESVCDTRLTEPLTDQLSLRLANDSSIRAGVMEPAVRSRLSYWPIVNVIDAVIGPVVSVMRSGGPAPTAALAGRDLAQHVRGAFAELAQRDPRVYRLYEHRKLWESQPAEISAATLQQRVDAAIAKQALQLQARASKPSLLTRLIAPVVTLGTALWFPIVQPILQIVLEEDITSMTRESLLLIVKLLSATALVQSVAFLAIYFVALWMWLRWLAYRRVDRALRRASDADHPAAVVLTWTNELLQPIRARAERLRSLNDRIRELTQDRVAA